MKIENLLSAIIGLANGAKTHKRTSNLNNIISLCQLALEGLKEQKG